MHYRDFKTVEIQSDDIIKMQVAGEGSDLSTEIDQGRNVVSPVDWMVSEKERRGPPASLSVYTQSDNENMKISGGGEGAVEGDNLANSILVP